MWTKIFGWGGPASIGVAMMALPETGWISQDAAKVVFILGAIVAAVCFTGLMIYTIGYAPKNWRNRFGVVNRENGRIPLVGLRDEAAKRGWVFDSKSLHILDLEEGLRQAGLDGTVSFYGKTDRQIESLIKREPLLPIPPDHWRTYWLNGPVLQETNDNITVRTYNLDLGGERGFVDIHADRKEIMRWLTTNAEAYRGRNLPDKVSLQDAARIAYEETRNTFQTRLFERLNKSPSKMLGVMAQEIIDDALIPLFGTHPPSTKQEKIPDDEAKEFEFSDDATELYNLYNMDQRWNNLFVRRRDFESRLSKIKTKYKESDNVAR